MNIAETRKINKTQKTRITKNTTLCFPLCRDINETSTGLHLTINTYESTTFNIVISINIPLPHMSLFLGTNDNKEY